MVLRASENVCTATVVSTFFVAFVMMVHDVNISVVLSLRCIDANFEMVNLSFE